MHVTLSTRRTLLLVVLHEGVAACGLAAPIISQLYVTNIMLLLRVGLENICLCKCARIGNGQSIVTCCMVFTEGFPFSIRVLLSSCLANECAYL